MLIFLNIRFLSKRNFILPKKYIYFEIILTFIPLKMNAIFDYIGSNYSYLIIPFISGLVGWGTNILALKMTFYPLEYVGIRPFGWQGIVPSKSKKMAITSVDLMADKLIDIQEVFSQIDPKIVSELMQDGMQTLSDKIVEEIALSQAPIAWRMLPKRKKREICDLIHAHILEMTAELMVDIKLNIRDLIDLKALAVSVLVNDKRLINTIFLEVGKKEFKFIERSGFYFGFLFGVPQMFLAYAYNPWWMLPAAGVMVGYLTNWLALKMIFRPVVERRFMGFSIQGLFFKRQKEVSETYASIVTERILTIENLFDFIVRGKDTRKITALLYKQISKITDNIAHSFKSVINIFAGEKQLEIIKNIAVYRLKEELPLEISVVYNYAENAIGLKQIMAEKMSALPVNEFENFLHPVFQEDEMKLIIVGAVLGGLAGMIQYLIFFY